MGRGNGMSAIALSKASVTLAMKDPGVALTTLGMTEPNKEDSMTHFSTQTPVQYHSYLKSMDWKRKKVEWINSGRPTRCWACEKPMPRNKSGFNFHHRTYKNLGNESLDDLVLLCMDDHRELSREWQELKSVRGHCLYNQTHIYVVSKRDSLGLSINSNNLIMKYLGAYHE
jgi:hypothetical protein